MSALTSTITGQPVEMLKVYFVSAYCSRLNERARFLVTAPDRGAASNDVSHDQLGEGYRVTSVEYVCTTVDAPFIQEV